VTGAYQQHTCFLLPLLAVYDSICLYLKGDKLTKLLAEPDEFGDFEFLSYWSVQFNYIIAGAIFLAWIKVSRLVRYSGHVLSDRIYMSVYWIAYCYMFMQWIACSYRFFVQEVKLKMFASFFCKICNIIS